MPIRSMAYRITVGESTGINGLKRLMPRLGSIIVAGEMEINDLYKTFPNFLL